MPLSYSHIRKLHRSHSVFSLAAQSNFVQLLRQPHQPRCFLSKYNHTPHYTTWSKDRPPNKFSRSAFCFLRFKRQLFPVHLVWCLTCLEADTDLACRLKLNLRAHILKAEQAANVSSHAFIIMKKYKIRNYWKDYFSGTLLIKGARSSLVAKALCYKPEGREFETRWSE
jgi:hypothetical protein